MKALLVLVALTTSFVAAASPPRLPIHPGHYTFHVRFAEQPNIQGIEITARIAGRHIVLINASDSDVFPKGVIADGILLWHSKSGQWIIGHRDADRFSEEVGGCSAGPDVIDLRQKIYWTC